MPDSKNVIAPVQKYKLKDGRFLFIVNKTEKPVNVFFTQTEESCTIEFRDGWVVK